MRSAKRFVALLAVSCACFLFGTPNLHATSYTFVGAWEVDQGPYWASDPSAYTGQEAAALLFGGNAGEYVTSTVDNNPTDINFESWVSTWGGACGGSFPCGTIVADNSVISTGGLYLSLGDQSAFVSDWARGSQYTNYAFEATAATPEPSTYLMLGAGVLFLAVVVSRNRKLANFSLGM